MTHHHLKSVPHPAGEPLLLVGGHAHLESEVVSQSTFVKKPTPAKGAHVKSAKQAHAPKVSHAAHQGTLYSQYVNPDGSVTTNIDAGGGTTPKHPKKSSHQKNTTPSHPMKGHKGSGSRYHAQPPNVYQQLAESAAQTAEQATSSGVHKAHHSGHKPKKHPATAASAPVPKTKAPRHHKGTPTTSASLTGGSSGKHHKKTGTGTPNLGHGGVPQAGTGSTATRHSSAPVGSTSQARQPSPPHSSSPISALGNHGHVGSVSFHVSYHPVRPNLNASHHH